MHAEGRKRRHRIILLLCKFLLRFCAWRHRALIVPPIDHELRVMGREATRQRQRELLTEFRDAR